MEIFKTLISDLHLPKIYYVKNELILQQSTPIDALIYCEFADLTIYHINFHGKEFILSNDNKYTGLLGEMEFFQPEPNSTLTIKANKSGYLYKIPRAKLLQAFTTRPEISLYLLESISSRYNENVTKLMNNITLSARDNVIGHILDIYKFTEVNMFKIPITLKAKQLGITSRCYRQILQDLEKEKKLLKEGTRYQIIDIAKLKTEVFC